MLPRLPGRCRADSGLSGIFCWACTARCWACWTSVLGVCLVHTASEAALWTSSGSCCNQGTWTGPFLGMSRKSFLTCEPIMFQGLLNWPSLACTQDVNLCSKYDNSHHCLPEPLLALPSLRQLLVRFPSLTSVQAGVSQLTRLEVLRIEGLQGKLVIEPGAAGPLLAKLDPVTVSKVLTSSGMETR